MRRSCGRILVLLAVALCTSGRVSARPELVLKLAHGLPTAHPVHEAMLFMAERVAARSDGRMKVEVFPSEHSVVPLVDAQGRRTGWVSVVRDITGRKSLEEQMRRQERLAAVGQLAGGIAHDFNNYLSTIMLYAGLISRAPGTGGDAARNAEVIIGECQRAAGLVQQVLDFSRRSVMDIQAVDTVALVEGAAGILQLTLPESISCLLYTSPSPRDRTRSRMPSSA